MSPGFYACLVAVLVGAAAVLGTGAPTPRSLPGREPRDRAAFGGRGFASISIFGHGIRESGQRPAQPPDPDPALVLELVAAALASGASAAGAVRAVGHSLSGPTGRHLERVAGALELSLPDELAWRDVPTSLIPLEQALVLGSVSGADLATMLHRSARDLRRARRRDAESAAARLAVRLVLPTGLCTLPAFVLLGIAPTVLSLVETFLD